MILSNEKENKQINIKYNEVKINLEIKYIMNLTKNYYFKF